MTGKLILTHALPGAGKDYWADREIAKDPANIIKVNRDDIRTSLFGEKYHRGKPDQKSESQVSQVHQKLIKQGLASGKTVIVSDTNLNQRFIPELAKIARDYNATLEQKHLDVPVELCKKRNAQRAAAGGRDVPENVIDRMATTAYGKDGRLKEFKIGEKVVFAYDRSGSDGERLVEEYNKKQGKAFPINGKGTANFDMDGTLADTRAISDKYMSRADGNRPNFHAFHKASEFIPANERILEMAKQAHREGIPVTVTTARMDSYAKETINWLENNGVPVSRLYMRKEADYRADYEVKKEIYELAKSEGVDFLHCFDDNPQAVRAWHDFGLQVTVVTYHEAVAGNDPSQYKTIEVETPFGSGFCLRCGSPLKDGKSIGPECAKYR